MARTKLLVVSLVLAAQRDCFLYASSWAGVSRRAARPGSQPFFSLAELRYLHIPKTGGSSVEEFGRAQLNASWGRYHYVDGHDDGGVVKRNAATSSTKGDKCDVASCSPWHVPPGAARGNAASYRTSPGFFESRRGVSSSPSITRSPSSASSSDGAVTFCSIRHPAERFVAQFHHDHDVDGYCNETRFVAWMADALHARRKCPAYHDCHFVPQVAYAAHCARERTLRLESLARDLAALLSCLATEDAPPDGKNRVVAMIDATDVEKHLPRIYGGEKQQSKRRTIDDATLDACRPRLAALALRDPAFLDLYTADLHLWRRHTRDGPPPACRQSHSPPALATKPTTTTTTATTTALRDPRRPRGGLHAPDAASSSSSSSSSRESVLSPPADEHIGLASASETRLEERRPETS